MNDVCAPCEAEDEKLIIPFLEDGFAEASSARKEEMLKRAKELWAASLFRKGRSPECSENGEDCPDDLCPELGGTWVHWTNAVGYRLIKQTTLKLGDRILGTATAESLMIEEEMSSFRQHTPAGEPKAQERGTQSWTLAYSGVRVGKRRSGRAWRECSQTVGKFHSKKSRP